MTFPVSRAWALSTLFIIAGLTQLSHAVDSDDARSIAQRQVGEVAAEEILLRAKLSTQARPSMSPEKRIAIGELALGSRDYERAIDTFCQVVELHRQGKVTSNSHADALFLLGESYFESGQPLSARRQYSALLDAAENVAYASYAGRGLARLVDVAVRTGRRETLESVQVRVQALTISDPSGSFDYARGKLAFARGKFTSARDILASLLSSSEYYPQAQYVLGVILLREALPGLPGPAAAQARKEGTLTPRRLLPAIAQFRKVTTLDVATEVHRHVVDVSQLAIGRLFYESGAFLQAADAYIQIDRASSVYSEMLFELAWVYVRVGDYQRAERAMELLSATVPNSLHVADGALLRADLMLRSGRYNEAQTAYEQVRDRFSEPSVTMVGVLDETKEPAVYYDRLVEEGMAVAGATKLPEFVLDWVKEEARGDRVFAVIDDVTSARRLERRGRQLANKLDAVLGAPSRARAFPKLEAALQKAYGLTNQLMQARRAVALGFEDVDNASHRGELRQVRASRRALMAAVARLPVTSSDFATRREASSGQWNRVSQAIQRVTLEADNLQAVINGLLRVLKEGSAYGVTNDVSRRKRYRAQVEANERDLEVYRERIAAYREEVERGKVQVGLGDSRFAEEEAVREQFRHFQAREIALLRAGGGEVADYLGSLDGTMSLISELESKLQSTEVQLDDQVRRGAIELRGRVRAESDKLRAYTQQLDALDQHGRTLLGEVAMKNFSQVSERLKGIVLRADVGMVQQAWEDREEQRRRLRDLQRTRAVAAQQIDAEAREVLDAEEEGN